VDALEQRLNLPVNALVNTITAMNASAKSGVDSEHHRGETSYERANGDATRGLANPCLGPVKQAPFYAVRLYPGDIGAATGFSTDTACRMLDSEGTPLDTFYACGNDMHSLLNGAYAGPGITLGPALTFGYIAGKHAAQSLKEPMPIRSTGKEHYA
jgi:succinate dehydrogenase/fumarate reductase flavoprotein subunit